MLRKRTRSVEKDQQMGHLTGSEFGAESHFYSENHKNKALFSVPRLFVGLSPRGLSDSDSVRSPTSPLDFRAFSNLGSPFRSPKSPHNAQQKSWDTSKVGLSIIDSLDNANKLSGEVLRSDSKNILFGPQMRTRTSNSQTHINSFKAPQSLPKNYANFPHTQTKSPLQKGNSNVVFEIGDTPLEPEPFGNFRSCSLDSCRSFPVLAGFADRSPGLSPRSSGLEKLASQASSPPLLIGGSLNLNNFSHVKPDSMSVTSGSGNGFIEALSGSEIELSEDYTCVISHGPNPKTTHIYGDCILEGHSNELMNNICKGEVKETEGVKSSTTPYPSVDFLSFCYTCRKKLEGKDIYIYRGEKAFCSFDCRSQEISIDEEMEKIIRSSENSPTSDDVEELFETGIFIT
ncbi:FCS-Like Zinc finger 10-like [Pistacia vera]|uniref:FCS-Like Zinc finger 10-like n=1 Tax=Pistacia vera TaxID=55513 RepID=UPI001262B11C|nr:FCS-Like Zinc finger 10-like [Pistacia vera]XP_031261081.1 FCS-Like Zinc finger 10-like [Pistacia vera]